MFQDNGIIWHDPTPYALPFFRSGDPNYLIESVRSPSNFVPKLRKLRKERVSLPGSIFELKKEEALSIVRKDNRNEKSADGMTVASKIEVLAAAAFKAYSVCRLCGWECGLNRFRLQGKCGLGSKGFISRPFVHIAEESPINAAIVANLGGCGLNCVYCIADRIVHHFEGQSTIDADGFWQMIIADMTRYQQDIPINTLEFTNPTENLASVIELLTKAPECVSLPIVFNCHLYGTQEFYELASPVVDVWLMDLRHCEPCAQELSGVRGYMQRAEEGMTAILKDPHSRVIVRLLIIPGHVDCCIASSIELLAQFKHKDQLFISVMDQYVPTVKLGSHPELDRRPSHDEIEKARLMVRQSGLKDIEIEAGDFWKRV
ncbi:MAG: hypothetical protein U5L00_07205 [Desulfovermiculus sp.]|nr:hypothetical protein [Desulfovermiculus sp.]